MRERFYHMLHYGIYGDQRQVTAVKKMFKVIYYKTFAWLQESVGVKRADELFEKIKKFRKMYVQMRGSTFYVIQRRFALDDRMVDSIESYL